MKLKKAKSGLAAKLHLEMRGRKRRVVPRWMKFAGPMAALAVVAGFGACGDRAESLITVAELSPACETYVAALRNCTSHLGVAATSNVDDHLQGILKDLSTTGKTEAEKEQLTASCAANAQRLTESCR